MFAKFSFSTKEQKLAVLAVVSVVVYRCAWSVFTQHTRDFPWSLTVDSGMGPGFRATPQLV